MSNHQALTPYTTHLSKESKVSQRPRDHLGPTANLEDNHRKLGPLYRSQAPIL